MNRVLSADPVASVLLAGDLSEPARLTVAQLRDWPQYPTRVSFDCATSGVRRHAFTGPLLHDVTVFAVPGLVPEHRKDRARFLLCVTGADGHQAVLSWAEIDPEFSRHPVLLATRANGVPLDRQGPQLVVPHDRCGSRYISAVTHIWVGAHLAAH